eukprot:scaffold4201_cov119-Isochrysis_galbana.AAC.10
MSAAPANGGADILTILPAHVPTNADGVPVLCPNRAGRRMRYTIAPIAPPSWTPMAAADGASSVGFGWSACNRLSASETKSASDLPNIAPRTVPRHARCVVCSLGMQQPMSTPCGHAMCAGCQPSPGEGDKIRCPKCDMVCMASSVKPAPMLLWLLGGVRVKYVPAQQCPGTSLPPRGQPDLRSAADAPRLPPQVSRCGVHPRVRSSVNGGPHVRMPLCPCPLPA